MSLLQVLGVYPQPWSPQQQLPDTSSGFDRSPPSFTMTGPEISSLYVDHGVLVEDVHLVLGSLTVALLRHVDKKCDKFPLFIIPDAFDYSYPKMLDGGISI